MAYYHHKKGNIFFPEKKKLDCPWPTQKVWLTDWLPFYYLSLLCSYSLLFIPYTKKPASNSTWVYVRMHYSISIVVREACGSRSRASEWLLTRHTYLLVRTYALLAHPFIFLVPTLEAGEEETERKKTPSFSFSLSFPSTTPQSYCCCWSLYVSACFFFLCFAAAAMGKLYGYLKTPGLL